MPAIIVNSQFFLIRRYTLKDGTQSFRCAKEKSHGCSYVLKVSKGSVKSTNGSHNHRRMSIEVLF
jgi:hypothetical protein